MKKRVVIVVVCCLALALGVVLAQGDAPKWTLKTPTATEFLQTITDSAAEFRQEPDSGYYESSLSKISGILFYLFPDPSQTSFQDLLDAYTASDIGHRDLFERGEWVKRMVEAWIGENKVDLSKAKALNFKDFYVTVIPRDFNGDGFNEYLLDIAKGAQVDRHSCVQDAEVVDYLVAQPTTNGYRFIETGLPWKGNDPNGRYSYGTGGLVELGFKDLNADGVPEWILLDGHETVGGPGMGYGDAGRLFILEWRNDGFVYLTPTDDAIRANPQLVTTSFVSSENIGCVGPYPLTVSWQFKNIDNDAALEVLQSQQYTDNWDCNRTETEIFDWNRDTKQYTYLNTKIAYDESSQNCIQRTAEETLWTGDYAAAIPLFEQALKLKPSTYTEDYDKEYASSLNQYLRERLALAYLMTGQGEKADPLVNTLHSEAISEDAIHAFADALFESRQNNQTPLQTCIAAYNVFTTHFPKIRVGFTGDDLFFSGNPYQPENIGCDAPKMLKQTLNSANLSVSSLPLDYLKSLGIDVLKSIRFETNHTVTWLVWPNVTGVELFLTPESNVYHIYYTSLDPFLETDAIQPIQLPDNAGWAIAMTGTYLDPYTISPWYGRYSSEYGGLQGPAACTLSNGEVSAVHSIALYRFQESDFSPIFSQQQCGTSLDSAFLGNDDTREMRLEVADCLDDYCTQADSHTVIYRWDAEEMTYLPPNQPQATSEPTSIPQPSPTPRPFPQYDVPYNAFEKRDFTAVIGMTPDTFQLNSDNDSMNSTNDQLGDYYLRAVALEALKRPDEALAEYVAIYEGAPESAWGKLARLHLECVSGC